MPIRIIFLKGKALSTCSGLFSSFLQSTLGVSIQADWISLGRILAHDWLQKILSLLR